jgi:hypothetical protein
MATSMGKKMAKTGVRMVPSPKPEKRVSAEVARAVAERTMYDKVVGDIVILV